MAFESFNDLKNINLENLSKEIVETKKEMAWLEGIEYISDEDITDPLKKLPEF